MEITLTETFPLESLPEAYKWHKFTSTCINGWDYSLALFLRTMHNLMSSPGARSWGIRLDGELLGMICFEPIWRSGGLVDGSCHIVLARKAWGQQVIDTAAAQLIPLMFNSTPSLLRLTSFTPGGYRPGLRVARALGFTQEGILHDAVWVKGQVRDIVICGLTRKTWEASQKEGESHG